jgi:predicted DNA-binding transcriptional regulator AlpA
MLNLLTAPELRALLKLSTHQFEKVVKEPGFPAPIIFGVRKRRWRESDVAAWLEGK